MGLLRRLVDAFDPPETRSIGSSDAELARILGGYGGGSFLVNPNTAQALSTVLACVNAISSSIASLPAYCYRIAGDARLEDPNHAVTQLIAGGPNQHQSWSDWVEWMLASALLRGNAVSEIVSDNRGAVVALKPIPWEWCGIQILANGRLLYTVSEINSVYGGVGGSRVLTQDQVFHLRDRSDDGLIGRSRLSRAAAVVSAGLSMQTFHEAMYANGIRPSGAVEVESKLSDVQFKRLQDQLEKLYSGTGNAAKALILENNVKWKPLSISPEDAEFLASRRFGTEEICRIFSVPPVIVGDLSNSSFHNTETLSRMFAIHCLAPWIKKLESLFARAIFARADHTIEIDMGGFLRGADEARWASWKVAAEAQILDLNEIRQAEGWNPRPPGWKPAGAPVPPAAAGGAQ